MEELHNLYKYTSIDSWSLDSLKNNSIHFTCPNDFNDPFDCRLNIYIDGTGNEWEKHKLRLQSSESIEELKKEFLIPEDQSESFHTDVQKKALLTTRVSCFSERPDNMLLWSHYANSHHGICLMFETKRHDTILYR